MRLPTTLQPTPTTRASLIQRRNVVCLAADMVLFMAALGLVSPLTLVPLFVSKLTDSPLAIGALTAAFQLGWLPQVIAAGRYEQSGSKRRWLIQFGLLERLPVLGLTACALLATTLSAPLVLGLVYLSRFSQSLLAGPAATAWLDYVGRVVPARRRGKFMGLSTMLGNLLGIGTAALAAPLLEWLPFPYGFAACFGLGFLLLLASFSGLLWVVEPDGPPPRPVRPLRAQLAELPRVLAGDPPFRRFIAALSLTMLGAMGASFVVVFAVAERGASDELAAWYTVTLLVGQVLANLGCGWLADRRGFGAVGLASALAGVAVGAGALLAPTALWLLPVFLLVGVSSGGTMLARLAGPMQFAPPDRLPTYAALSGTLVSLVAAVAPMLGGLIVALFGYHWLFAASLVLSLAAMPMFGARRPTKVLKI